MSIRARHAPSDIRLRAGADAVVLPYRRSTQSGALHIAKVHGLLLVVSRALGYHRGDSGV